ncbi:response regulator [Methylocystis sp. IM4]|uniref:response regulator transcription factor n=1 Tax=Methylocystis sp. IM4 TaxID=3136560 RepID=UPI00311A010F
MIVYLIAGQGERDAIATLLSGHTYEIRPYPDVAAFLAEADLEPPGCVLIDVQPSDPTAMRELRAIRRSLPIIALSSRANVALAVRAMKEGAADFLQKPIEPEKLDAAVRAALDESRAWFERGRKKGAARALRIAQHAGAGRRGRRHAWLRQSRGRVATGDQAAHGGDSPLQCNEQARRPHLAGPRARSGSTWGPPWRN